MLVNDRDFLLIRADVNHCDSSCLFHDNNWECVVYENAAHNAVGEANNQRLFFWRPADDFDVLDTCFHDPLTDEDAREGKKLDFCGGALLH
jgi:hypothetical protein